MLNNNQNFANLSLMKPRPNSKSCFIIVNLKKEQESVDVTTPRHEDRSENAKNGTEHSAIEGTSNKTLKPQQSEKEHGNPVKEELSDNAQG